MVAFATQVKRRRGTEAQNNEFTGAEGEIVVDLTNMTLRVHDGTTKGGFVVGGAGRNIGDIFFTARTEPSINGAFEADGSTYNTDDFTGGNSIGELLAGGKLPYVPLAEFATIVSANGSCRCFGWDGGTEFRVPKLSNVFIEAGIAATAGEFIPAGVPNVQSEQAFSTAVGMPQSIGDQGGAIYTITATTASYYNPGSGSGSRVNGYGIDLSRGNPIYGNSDTVQPPAVKYRAMVQLAVSATDDALMTAGGVLNDIANLKNAVSPVGTIIAFAGTTPPPGWLICDGGEISRASYASLFSVIGETYGAGDGATSFNLPDKSVLPLGTMANVSVFGNGYTLGWTLSTAGNNYYPTVPPPVTGTEGLGIGAATTTKYAVGATTPAAIEATQQRAYGVSTNPNYSGLTGTVDLSTATGAKAIVCIKY